ncbi:SycD/LcrH family type III secretion system chaperone [Spongorhabdus nitratireducens]
MTGQQSSDNEQDLQSMLDNHLVQGGTFKDFQQISDEAMDATFVMAHGHFSNERYEEAAKAFQYLCFHDHWNPRYFVGLAACQQMLGLFGQAIETYAYAHRVKPDDPGPLYFLGDCYVCLKQDDKARDVYKKAVKLSQGRKEFARQVSRVMRFLTADIDSGKEQ